MSLRLKLEVLLSFGKKQQKSGQSLFEPRLLRVRAGENGRRLLVSLARGLGCAGGRAAA
jgi:hypothetical protein